MDDNRIKLNPCWIAQKAQGLALVWLLGFNQVMAQAPSSRVPQREPVITGLYPPGVAVGRTTKWTLSGRNLDVDSRLRISGSGVEVLDQQMTAEGRLTVSVRTHATAAPGVRELRADGPFGLSNLVLFRVDTLDQIEESEPNDDPAHADALSLNAVVSGVLEDRDVDHVRIEGRGGEPVTVEVEARRLGSPIRPVVTLLDGAGRSLIQERETPGLEGDCRVTSRFPTDGTIVVRVHDALYQGGAGTSYRLRVFTIPFATALFPLGGARGEPIDLIVSGGTLDVPLRQRIVMPDHPGTFVEIGPFDGPSGPLIVPYRLYVGEGPHIVEAQLSPQGRPGTRLPRGSTANGCIEKPGEVDRYRVAVRQGEKLRVGIQAAPLGSWLDSVVTVRDDQGRRIAENDDPLEGDSTLVVPWSSGQGAFPTDSLLVHQAEADGDWLIEVADRYGNGGAEFAYRLTVEPARPDFLVTFQPDQATKRLELGEPGTGTEALGTEASNGPAGVLNLAPGSSRRVRLRIAVEGRIPSIVLRATGLPSGVTAEPVTIRAERGTGRPAAGKFRPTQLPAELTLQVAEDAGSAVGELKVIATASMTDGAPLSREATVWIPLGQGTEMFPLQPVFRELSALPVKVVRSLGAGQP
ncbi:hypothetical protein V5E97_18375 [Singulisphaera sp. Ch08]|uniref:Quinohemoprotein amine dehydrogenase alpha subunit domain-containing protein n=1 Tax=Singulisphaera sp. Ch08 TaxID=3120278 RepID=A0AAU7CS64_9BACT